MLDTASFTYVIRDNVLSQFRDRSTPSVTSDIFSPTSSFGLSRFGDRCFSDLCGDEASISVWDDRFNESQQAIAEHKTPFLVMCEAHDQSSTDVTSPTYHLKDLAVVARSVMTAKYRPWFISAIQDDKAGRPVQALRHIFKAVDDLLYTRNFSEVDSWLSSLIACDLSDNLIVGILSITRPASSHLPSRRNFLKAAWQVVEHRGRDPKKLLGGLTGPEASRWGNLASCRT